MKPTPAFPASIPYATLLKTHPDYDAERMREHEAFFEGGKAFDELFDKDEGKLIIKRESEGASRNTGPTSNPAARYENPAAAEMAYSTNIGTDSFKARKKYNSYKPRVAGLIHFIIRSVLSSAPVIVATKKGNTKERSPLHIVLGWFGIDKENPDDPDVQFYHNLNDNYDNCGNSVISFLDSLLRDICIHGRAFAGIGFPHIEPEKYNDADAPTDAEFTAAGGKNGFGVFYPAIEIDDWITDDGQLEQIRRHYTCEERSNPALPPDRKFERWHYIRKEGIYTYEIEWKNTAAPQAVPSFEKPNSETPVAFKEFKPSSLKELPVKKIDLGIHIMERLRPCIKDQINMSIDLRWAIARDVYNLLVVKTKQPEISIDPVQMALRLPGDNDSAQILNTGGAGIEPLFKMLDRNDDETYETLMALILKSAAQPSNGRQSGEAKRMDYNTFETFLMVFSAPLLSLLNWQLNLIRKTRGNDQILTTVHGLVNFDIESTSKIIADAKAVLDMGIPDSAAKAIKFRAYRAYMGTSATPEQLEHVVKEFGAQTAQSTPAPAGVPNNNAP